MANLMPYDELNTLKQYFIAAQAENGSISPDDAEDEILDLLIMAYVFGVQSASDSLGMDITADPDKMRESIYKRIADKDFAQRAREAAERGDTADLALIAETDAHRVYSEAVVEAGRASGRPVKKRWETMQDSRVRETHDYLQSMVVDLNDEFYTFDGDHALGPGGFQLAENNCGCRCVLDLIPAE